MNYPPPPSSAWILDRNTGARMSNANHCLKGCLDVAYGEETAVAAGVTFIDWTSESSQQEFVIEATGVAPYQSGHFYQRELPCLLQILRAMPPLDLVIIDGYVWLGGEDKPGLGAHLYDVIHVPVIGVAKSRYHSACATELVRGASARPLFISAIGIDTCLAAQHIAAMHGDNRIPTLLKRVDHLTRFPEAIQIRS